MSVTSCEFQIIFCDEPGPSIGFLLPLIGGMVIKLADKELQVDLKIGIKKNLPKGMRNEKSLHWWIEDVYPLTYHCF